MSKTPPSQTGKQPTPILNLHQLAPRSGRTYAQLRSAWLAGWLKADAIDDRGSPYFNVTRLKEIRRTLHGLLGRSALKRDEVADKEEKEWAKMVKWAAGDPAPAEEGEPE